jgi:hypothetical protein
MKIMEAIMRMTDWALRDQIKEMMIKDDAGRRSQTHFVRRTKRAAAETARRLQAHQRGGTRLPLGPR